MPPTRAKVKPLAIKHLTNVFSNVQAGYSRMSDDEKFAISNLVLQLESKLTMGDTTTCSVMHTSEGTAVMVPCQSSLKKQPSKRLQPKDSNICQTFKIKCDL